MSALPHNSCRVWSRPARNYAAATGLVARFVVALSRAALAGAQVRGDVLGPQQEGNALPAGIDDEAHLGVGRGGQQQPRAHRQAVDRAARPRAEGDVAEQALVRGRARAQAQVGRVKRDVGVAQAHDHPPHVQGARLQLHRVLRHQFETLAGDGRVGELDHRDGGAVGGGGCGGGGHVRAAGG